MSKLYTENPNKNFNNFYWDYILLLFYTFRNFICPWHQGSKLNLEKSSIPVILSNKYAKYLSAIKLFAFAVSIIL